MEGAAIVSKPRTLKLRPRPMNGTDVRDWEQEINRQFADMDINFRVKVDAKYTLGDREATERLLYALGIDRDEMKDGVTPALRIKVRHGRLTAAEKARKAARVGCRRRLRKKYAKPRRVTRSMAEAPVRRSSGGAWRRRTAPLSQPKSSQ